LPKQSRRFGATTSTLHANKDSVHIASFGWIVGCFCPNDGFAGRHLKAETSSPYGAKVITPSDKDNMLSSKRELRTKVAAQRHPSRRCDPHLLTFR
jgi:hypothetical protein